MTACIGDIQGEITDLEITIEEMITIHVLHNLDPMFDPFIEFVEDKAKEDTKAPDFEQLCKDLENEELKILHNQKRDGSNKLHG